MSYTKYNDWDMFNRFENVIETYMPEYGQGKTMASQIATACNKLVYKWFNDGDVYDNSYYMSGWCNDLSSYANWLYKYIDNAVILDEVENCESDEEYARILFDLCVDCLDSEYIEQFADKEAIGDIYECNGKFKFVEYNEDEDKEEIW